MNSKEKKKNKVYNRFKKDELKSQIAEGSYKVSDIFSTDEELIAAHEIFTEVLIGRI